MYSMNTSVAWPHSGRGAGSIDKQRSTSTFSESALQPTGTTRGMSLIVARPDGT